MRKNINPTGRVVLLVSILGLAVMLSCLSADDAMRAQVDSTPVPPLRLAEKLEAVELDAIVVFGVNGTTQDYWFNVNANTDLAKRLYSCIGRSSEAKPYLGHHPVGEEQMIIQFGVADMIGQARYYPRLNELFMTNILEPPPSDPIAKRTVLRMKLPEDFRQILDEVLHSSDVQQST